MMSSTSSLTGVLVNLFNENFLNDSEQDANSVLTELDKGLRSTKLGVQCEAIVRFPRLFEKYPFPILINSSFLKLAEFFWNGSNLLRFWVLRVCQQSENHLDKILNIDAFVKRIFMVIHSNDPVARALTLRTLGAVSRVIPEKQQVHHAIRRALDSHDEVEVEAAIYASGQFAAQSRSFAISMCAKISDMIESLLIPVQMKLLLIPVLRHMHHDANTAALVRELCLNLLPKYTAASFVVAILDSLTELSARTLTGVPNQVQLLLNFLGDTRKTVRSQALRSLTALAAPQCVHAWPKASIDALIGKAQTCDSPREQYLYLSILLQLSACPLTCHTLLHEHQTALLTLCAPCIGQNDYAMASQALGILAAVGEHRKVADPQCLIQFHMEGLLICCVGVEGGARDLRKILAVAVRVGRANEKFGKMLVVLLTGLLSDTNAATYPAANTVPLCDALGALSAHFQLKKFAPPVIEMHVIKPKAVPVNPVLERLPLILEKLHALTETSQPNNAQLITIELLVAITLQTLIGCFMPLAVRNVLERCSARTNLWTQYRLARSASRYGQHYMAAHIYAQISRHTVVDKLHFYLIALTHLSQAECVLNHGVTYATMSQQYEHCGPHPTAAGAKRIRSVTRLPIMNRLEGAINLYWQALASMRASSSPAHPLHFQLDYLRLRAQFLQTLRAIVTVKNSHIIVPPPAIAGALAQNSRDYLQKYGHVTNQLRRLVKAVRMCADAYSRLYKASFDADAVTLEHLDIAEYQCALLAHILETICYPTPSEAPTLNNALGGQHPETRYFTSRCRNMRQLHRHLPLESVNGKTISNCHLEVIMAEIELIIKTPLCLPRYFYQVLQSTQIKLSVSPQPRNVGESVIVQPGSNLVIKVEGVIQHYGKQSALFRSVDAVQLCLTSQLLPPRLVNNSTDAGAKGATAANDTVLLTQTVKPQRDFLSGSFLLPISSGGQWQVTLETYVVDENSITWCTGPKNSMLVRVLEDPAKVVPTALQSGQTRRF